MRKLFQVVALVTIISGTSILDTRVQEAQAQEDRFGDCYRYHQLIKQGDTRYIPQYHALRSQDFEKQNQTVEGTWKYHCCGGKYYGDIRLYQKGNRITGVYKDSVNNSVGNIDGIIQGNKVSFTIELFGRYPGRQFYELTLSPNGQILEGTFGGSRDESVGVDFKAIRQ